MSTNLIGPFPGMQTMALESSARVVITGGKAGPGKTFGMLLPPLYFLASKLPVSCIIFRPNADDLLDDGGIMSDAREIYLPHRAIAREPPRSDFRWSMGRGKRLSIKFRSLVKAGDELKHMGPQRAYIAFDQLELFLLQHFTYMFTRGRAKKEYGFDPWVQATVNPVVRGHPRNGWIRELIDWWIADDGFPDPTRRGKIRHFIGAPDDHPDPFVVDTKENLLKRWPKKHPISLTFIHGERSENPTVDWDKYDEMIGVEHRQYIQDQLIGGNWNVGPKDETMIWDVPATSTFKDTDEDFLGAIHADHRRFVSGWDYGRTEKALVWVFGLLQPGSPPTLWILGGIVWTDADYMRAAAERATMIEYFANLYGISIAWDDVRDGQDPSGESRTSAGDSWGRALRSQNVPLQNISHIAAPHDTDAKTFVNSPEGFKLRTDMVQSWLEKERLRTRTGSREADTILRGMRAWGYDVPDGTKLIDVNRYRLAPMKNAPSHIGDAVTYMVVLADHLCRQDQWMNTSGGSNGGQRQRIVRPLTGPFNGPSLPGP